MKKLQILSIFIFFFYTSFTQVITKKEAIEFAQKLRQVEILSKKGEKRLLEKINADSLYWNSQGSVFFPDSKESKECSIAGILVFCHSIFEQETYWRLGYFDYEKISDEVFKELNFKSLTPDNQKKLDSEIEKKMMEFEGTKIELNITPEDKSEFEQTLNPPVFNQKPKYGYVHTKRSVLGKTLTRTIDELFEIGLLNQKIYEEVLNNKNINSELDFFEFAAKRSSFYQNIEKNKELDLKFIKSQFKTKLLNEQNYQRAIQAYEHGDIKNRFDLLSFSENTLIFEYQNLPKEPDLFYAEIYYQLKKLFPDFHYKDWEFNMTLDTA